MKSVTIKDGIRFYHATARRRVEAFLDAGSFTEWLGPQERLTSPHLPEFDLPVSFDDGVVIGCGKLDGREVYVAAQEGGFLGGSIGEVHGAKVTGILRRAVERRPAAVVLLFDCGGVRLQEANAGEMAVSEMIRAALACRRAGVPVLALVAGANGAFGGAGILSLCCDRVIASESARLGVSGPEVIETVMGAEAFDSRDRALVWRTVGGKNRYLYGEVDTLVEDCAGVWREATLAALDAIAGEPARWSLAGLKAEHEALAARVEQYGDAGDALKIWERMGLETPQAIPLMEVPELVAMAKAKGVRS